MRFRVRCKLPTGQPAIVKHDGANAFEAAEYAGRALRTAGHDLASIRDITIKSMKDSKQSSVYIGKVPTAKRRPKGNAAAAAPVANPSGQKTATAAAAKPAATTTAKK